MMEYKKALTEGAKHHLHMVWSGCFSESELETAFMAKANTIAEIYGERYDTTYQSLRFEVKALDKTRDYWYSEYVEKHVEE